MTSRHGKTPRRGNAESSLPVGGKYSKGEERENRDLSTQAAALAMHTAADGEAIWEVALDALTGGRLIAARAVLLFLLEPEHGELRGQWCGPLPNCKDAASQRVEALRALRIATDVGAEYPLVQAMRAKAPLEVPAEDEPVLRDFLAAFPETPRRAVLLGLRGHERTVGVLVVGLAGGEGRADAGGLRAMEFLAGHLGVALERWQTGHDHSLVSRAVTSLEDGVGVLLGGTNLADALLATARTATSVTRAGRALVWTYNEASRELTLAAQYVGTSLTSEVLDAALPRFHRIAQTCAQQGGAFLYPDLRDVPELELQNLPGPVSACAVPLSAFGEMLGVLAVLERVPDTRGQRTAFRQSDEDRLRLVAAPAALTVRVTRLQETLADTERHLKESQRVLVEAERMASLGELSGRLIEELRSPVAAISSFARRVERRLSRSDASREDMEIICRESGRLEELLSQQASVTHPRKPRLAMRQLTQIVHEAVVLVREDLMGRGIFLEETYADRTPELLLDGERMKQVVLNILRSSIEVITDGDTLRIETLREGDRVLLEIAHTGRPVDGEILDQLFVPFATAGPAGAGLGLAIAHQVIKEHSGEISVRTEGEWGAIFTVSLPIRANQERRRGQDRRAGRDRRRRGRRDDAA